MPVVGDRIVIDGTKVGQQRREGELVALVGRMIRVRWTDGSESLLTPAPGSVTFLAAGGAAAAKGSKSSAAGAKKTPKNAASAGSKKAAKKR